MIHKVAYFTNKGKVRPNNEDALLVGDRVFGEADFQKCRYEEFEGENLLLAVADGMGGHAGGEIAARFTLETLVQESPLKEKDEVIKALHKARERLEEYVKDNPYLFGLGCAVAGLAIWDRKAVAFNVGDCRVYRFIGGRLMKLTRDHSVVEELLLDGLITPEEARSHPERNILTSAVIGDGYATEMKVFTAEVDISAGGKFLICSDGLWDELEDEEIKMCMSSEDPCVEFLSLLSGKPLRDNVSFIVSEVHI